MRLQPIASTNIVLPQGTWQFMSAALLQNPTKPHEVQDDMESFIHVVTYHGLRYMDHNQPDEVGQMMEALFDEYHIGSKGRYVGGSNKIANFVSRGTIKEDFAFNFSPLTIWLDTAINMVRAWMWARTMKLVGIPVPFSDHSDLRNAWEDCFTQPDWPDNDKTPDQLEKARKKAEAAEVTQEAPPTKSQSSKRTRDEGEKEVEVERSTASKRPRKENRPKTRTRTKSGSKVRPPGPANGTI